MKESFLIEKWLKGELTEEEQKAFDMLDEARFNTFIIENAKHFKASQFTKIQEFHAFKKHYESKDFKKTNKLPFFSILKIAAVIIISLGVYFIFFHNTNTTIETKIAEKQTIELPDLSQVTLNSLSTITFDSKNWNDKRKLELEGEAFFKVSTGEIFNVKTPNGVISVLGTEFNVKDRESLFEVTCFEGLVNVAFDTINKKLNAGETFLVLNNKVIYRKTNQLSPKWRDDVSDFNAMPIKEVFSEMERHYKIKIKFNDVDDNRLFTGAFPHDNLEKALQSITIPMNMTYELKSSNLVTVHGDKN